MAAEIRPASRIGLVAAVAGIFSTLALGGLALATSAEAAFSLAAFDGAVQKADGSAFTQAGGHPYSASVTFDLNRTTDDAGRVVSDGGSIKSLVTDLPPGLVGNPTAVPRCSKGLRVPSSAEATGAFGLGQESFCSPNTIVGNARVIVAFFGFPQMIAAPVFNVEPPPGVAAQLAFSYLGQRTYIDAKVRTDGSYGVSASVRGISQAAVVLGGTVTLWGVPADPSHDAQRCLSFLGSLPELGPEPECSDAGGLFPLLAPHAAGIPPQAFLTNPTSCPPAGVGLETRLRAESWLSGASDEGVFVSHLPPGYPAPPNSWGASVGPTGCDRLPFDPKLTVTPDSKIPDSPTGMSIDLVFPQENILNPSGIATAHLRTAKVVLPEGMTISPSSADGLRDCTDAQLSVNSGAPVSCPPASKIGTVRATTPLLEEELTGSVFVGAQKSMDPESGDLFRIFLVLENEDRGILVKLQGQVRANAKTGRLETTFANNPQLPVSRISLRLKGGDRAPLANPPTCGVQSVSTTLTSWGGQMATPSDSFALDCPGVKGFSPSIRAGTHNAIGGAFSPLTVAFARPDRQEYLGGLAVRMPSGLLAKLKGVPLCAESQAAAGACPIESRIGTATVGAGPGGHPYFVKGSVSLTGPYRGAPYGLSTSVRAVAGPFDLGTVVVRQAIYVDPTDARLTVVSDPLPVIVKGVPLRLRTVSVDVDRPTFSLNPTSCAEKQIAGTLTSAAGTTALVSQRFQVGDCQSLGFSPKLSFRLTGKGETTGGRHPGLQTVLTQPGGQAHIKKVEVKLPLSLALDPDNATSDALCDFTEGQKTDPHCPKSSIIGSATTRTPLLNRLLKGRVYFVKNVRISSTGRPIRTLPTLLVALRGEVALNLRAKTKVSGGKLVTTFPIVPDAPVSRFVLNLKGGAKGILTVSKGNLCARKQVSDLTIAAHNGKRLSPEVVMKTPCRSLHKSG